MEESYDTGVISGIVMYMMLVALVLLGGAAFWFRYHVFGAILAIGAAGLLAWVVFGQAGM
jgi:hypothetical protein